MPERKEKKSIADYMNSLSEEERYKLRQKGGWASAEVRRRKKRMRETIETVLQAPVFDETTRQRLQELGMDITVQDAIMLAVSGRAQGGDVAAARFLRDTVGEKPMDAPAVNTLDAETLAQYDLSQLSNEQLVQLAQAAGDGECGGEAADCGML